MKRGAPGTTEEERNSKSARVDEGPSTIQNGDANDSISSLLNDVKQEAKQASKSTSGSGIAAKLAKAKALAAKAAEAKRAVAAKAKAASEKSKAGSDGSEVKVGVGGVMSGFEAPTAVPKTTMMNVNRETMPVAQGSASASSASTAQLLTTTERELTAKDMAGNPLFDPRLGLPSVGRTRRATFNFLEPGAMIKKGAEVRAAAAEAAEAAAAEAAAKAEAAEALSRRTAGMIDREQTEKNLGKGEIAWWDVDFIVNGDEEGKTYPHVSEVSGVKKLDWAIVSGIDDLVEHPVPVRTAASAPAKLTLKTMLTKKEKKRLKRRNKQEKLKEASDRVRLGLDPPPPPKMTLKNFLRVLGSKAADNPTAVEAEVRAQVEARVRKHLETNAARMLTSEQRREKTIRKLTEDTSSGVHVTLYRLKDLSHPSDRFKITKTAEQLYLSGTACYARGWVLVVVEGGPKAQRKYKRLLTVRMKWDGKERTDDDDNDDDDDDDDDGGDEGDAGHKGSRVGGGGSGGADEATPMEGLQSSTTGNALGGHVNSSHSYDMAPVEVVWEGIVDKAAFDGFTIKRRWDGDDVALRAWLAERGVGHYYDMAVKYVSASQQAVIF